MHTIFVVEDNDGIRDMMLYALESAGYRARGFQSAEPFWQAIEGQLPQLILLDIMLPGEDGLSILRALKQHPKRRQVPVIMLTAKGGEIDRIRGLDMGADDYIVKPFSVMEAISRVRAVLRRWADEETDAHLYRAGEIALNEAKRTVSAQGQEVVLTYKEFELLLYMMMNRDIVLSRDKLLENVWGFDYRGESRTVDMHIKTLRQKLGAAGDAIKTVRNVGYKIES